MQIQLFWNEWMSIWNALIMILNIKIIFHENANTIVLK